MTVDELLDELEGLSARGLGTLRIYYADGSAWLTLVESVSVGRQQDERPCVVMNDGAAPGEAARVLPA